MRKTVLGLLSRLLAHAASGQSGTEPIKVADLLKIKQIDGITLSRDGSFLP